MARGPHLSELAAEWQALGAKPQHVRRIFLAWAGLAPWEARKGESFPKAVAEALDGLPAHKLHCSVLAEEAIKSAIQNYYDRNGIDYDRSQFPDCASCSHDHCL